MLMRLREWLRPLIVDRLVCILLTAAFFTSVLTWALILWRLGQVIIAGRIIALHYSIYLGVNDVGPAMYGLSAPILGTGILITNTVLIRRAYDRNRVSALVLMCLTVFFELLAFTGAGYLAVLNIQT